MSDSCQALESLCTKNLYAVFTLQGSYFQGERGVHILKQFGVDAFCLGILEHHGKEEVTGLVESRAQVLRLREPHDGSGQFVVVGQ